MNKKKLVLTASLVVLVAAAILAIALVITFNANGTAFAADITSGGGTTGETTVTYTVQDTWKVTIPETIDLAGDGTGTVEASGVKIEKGKNLTVTVTSQNDWELFEGGEKGTPGDGIKYELKKEGTKLNDGDNVLEVAAGTDGISQKLTAEITEYKKDNLSTGGKAYEDTLTFTVTVA